jgi:hypothetical protein
MLSLLTVAILAGAPHAPAIYKAVERPILLARLQGEWVCHRTDWGSDRISRERLVIRGSLLYRYSPVPVDMPGHPDPRLRAVQQIESISPTSLCVVAIRSPYSDRPRGTSPYSVEPNTLTLGPVLFQRVPPAR